MGQFTLGIVMDMVTGRGFDLIYILGITLILSGLILQYLGKKNNIERAIIIKQ